MSNKPFDPRNIMGFCTDTMQLARPNTTAATLGAAAGGDKPTFTKERAARIHAYTADWAARHERGITADKVEAYLATCKPFSP